METKTATFFMKRQETREFADALNTISMAGDMSELDLCEVEKIDGLVAQLHDVLECAKSSIIRVTLSDDVWKAIMYVNGDLIIMSVYCNNPDPEELAAIDLVNEFIIVSGRKLGRSIFRSREDKKLIEEALGESLDLLE